MNISVEKTICHLEEFAIQKGSPESKDKVLYTCLDIAIDDFDNDTSIRNLLHLVFDCSSNYV